MKTILDITLEFAKKHCANGNYVSFNEIFTAVEEELKEKWELEAEVKKETYEKIQVNKIGELYRLLTVDSRFERNANGEWTTRVGFK
ncbi:DNA-directed RNA polymerase subunit delta [Mycoplasmopsis columbina]|uniref:HTH HARE-type domain-containing protein n=1 Tax=Mycoplasmopsis columbina SF7 TaxID=1037410 RepID=F9UJ75_9BACT|nr:hypothetical protein [Mycoplasmopsis columbina]EGV00571.1 hypothetical protein MCSF7_02664 [Mycoplasmopsis columbina SF7]VEU77183.1 Uncharacterised protein [Mycoplasmopsis columbina]